MLSIDFSFAPPNCRPSQILDGPVSSHDKIAYTIGLRALHTSQVFRLEMDLVMGWRICLERRFDRPPVEADAMWNAIELVEKEKAKRDPHFAKWHEIKKENRARLRA